MKTQGKSRAAAWVEAIRPRTLPVSCAGVLAGTACALSGGYFRWLPACICLLFAILAQIVSNFANEYYDFRNGLDRKGREGFRRGVTEGDISPQAMKRATYGLLAATAAVGCCLIPFGGWLLVAVGAAIALFAIAYSAGPYPLSHHGLGDVAVVFFFGIVPVYFTAWVQLGAAPSPYTLAIGVATGLLAANVLIVNNYRDRDDDLAVGKRTTAVIFGRRAMGALYLAAAWCAVILTAAVLLACGDTVWAGLILLSGIMPTMLQRRIVRRSGAALNPLLGKTAAYVLLYAILLLLAAIF